ncbi:hypothetical protein [Streptomyces sp. NPDC015131]|uniref:hypothetical protein n=1 Tax=Streptomyces sp. NPDC015131 TaxID=3364941 RepID=UPI0036FB9718
MVVRTRTALALGAALVLLTGCSDGGGGDAKSSASPTGPEAAPAPSRTTFSSYADFPGKDFVTTEPGMDLGVRVKPVDTAWTPELAGKPADGGKHFFAVYVAVTGELPDRGVEKAKLDYLRLKYKSTEKPCEFGESGFCFREAFPSSSLVDLDDAQESGGWRTHSWQTGLLGRDIERGETKMGVVGFSLPDTEKAASFELCGPTKEAQVDTDKFACVPVKTPTRT